MAEQEWSNWSGSLRFVPGRVVAPDNEETLADIIRRAAADGHTVRVAGAGHSSVPLVETDGILVSLENFRGLELVDSSANVVAMQAGMTLKEAGESLLESGLALHNLGDVDMQTVVGAIGTGTHGTGRRLRDLSSALTGVRMVTARGDIIERTFERDSNFIRASRVSLGTLGIFTTLQLKLLPAYTLRRREWCTHVDDCMTHLDELVEENRNFDFYWYPRSDEVKLRVMDHPGKGTDELPFAKLTEDKTGWSAEVIPKTRILKFDEMEYALPAAAGPACFQEVRRRIKERHRRNVGWRVLYRTVAEDDTFLSNEYGRDTVTISLHQNAGLPFHDFFKDIEDIFRYHDGRPHWGKKHNLTAAELRPLYPMWDRFQEIRSHMDRDGTFLNPYLRELLGVEPGD
ncbi:MAG: FAD-binding protein [Thermoleophilia bacterium]|nr:FAD-binding protein [Thermoleophilia bacterium]